MNGIVPRLLVSAILLSVFTVSGVLTAQAPPAAPAKPDSAAVTAIVEKAKKIAGSEWAAEANFFCLASHGNSENDPLIEPAKIFDNVYAIGRTGTVVYALDTSAGIILIDTGYAKDVESVLLAGMKKLGLDPARIKVVIITHGHADHFGGAAYLQEHHSQGNDAPRIVMSAADWDLMLNPPPAPGADKGNAARVIPPKMDIVAMEAQPIVLGDEKVTPVFIPGHTPGSIALIFPVKDGGKTHMAGLFGGTILVSGRISDDGLQQYLRSIAHYKEEARKMKVDVELQNHPIFDGMENRLAKLRERKPGDPNPFVVGQANYGKFLDVMAECMRAAVARRAE